MLDQNGYLECVKTFVDGVCRKFDYSSEQKAKIQQEYEKLHETFEAYRFFKSFTIEGEYKRKIHIFSENDRKPLIMHLEIDEKNFFAEAELISNILKYVSKPFQGYAAFYSYDNHWFWLMTTRISVGKFCQFEFLVTWKCGDKKNVAIVRK